MATWSDIDITLAKDQSGDIKKATDINAIVNSLGNIFTTMQGSRRMLPEAFLPIYEMLFNPIDDITARNIGIEMLRAIKDWETRIVVENINVYPDEDNNRYDVSLIFRVIDTNERAKYSTILYQN